MLATPATAAAVADHKASYPVTAAAAVSESTPATADVGQLPRRYPGDRRRRRVGINPGDRGRRPATRNRMIELNAVNPGDRGRRPATRDRM